MTMNVHNGQILGLGSFPTYDPTVFTKPMTQSQVERALPRPGSGAAHRPRDPGLYPTGSTFKLDHRDGGARKRRDHALDDDLRRRLS